MGKKKRSKKAIAGISAFVLGTSAFVPALPVYGAEGISVNPQIHYQTLKGWGTSLCWWGNTIGSWGDQDFNGNGRPDREEIAELAFSPEYLNLNIVRYNVGGGDKENTSIKRCEGLVPGWTEDMTGTKDGTGEFNVEEFYSKSTEEMADAGQLWMLEQANQWRQEEGDIINEVFSNSPPYYMTKSGSSTGGYNWDKNNLKDDQYDEFAQYLARATKWVDQNLEKKYGTGVSYVEPLNEPDTNYWMDGSTKQEGCIFNTGELQSKAYREMQKALETEGLTDIQITGTDETSLWSANNSFNRLDNDVKENMTTIGAHTYSGNDSERNELRQTAQKYDKDLWMSEVTKGGGAHEEGCHESMSAVNTRSQSEGIMADLKYMQPTAWIAWLIADSEYECLQTNSNWGLLHAVFEKDGPVPDYHTNLVNSDGSKKDWVPEEGYWAITKQFYTMMQYSKYLKAGYTMIEVGDSNMCAAVSPTGDELVIVAQNFGSERNVSLDLSKFSGDMTAEVFRTSDTENCESVDVQDVSDTTLEMTLPTNSVSTAVVRANDGSSVCNMENYSKIVDAEVVKPDEDWTKSENKFTYKGSWGDSAEEFGGGKYSTEENAGVTFTFEGDQAAIYGTKAPEGAVVNVEVDGEEKGQIELTAKEKDGEVMLFDTGKLAQGTHTVTLTKADGEGNKLLEINYARIISGEFIEDILRAESFEDIYTIAGQKPEFPKTVQVVTDKGTTKEKAVEWNVKDIDFTQDVTVYGKIEGTNKTVPVNVKVIADNIEYFVDCNSLNSPLYEKIDTLSKLKNDTPDQAYEEGSWGYKEKYGEYNGDINDHYDTGWYAYGGQSIEYTFPLEAGTYNVDFGFKEWWREGNKSRPMSISMTVNGETTELGKTNTWNGGSWWNKVSYEITCEEAADVTFTIAKAENNDPVLSFIQIQREEKVEEISRLDVLIEKAKELLNNEDAYTLSSAQALKDALTQAELLNQTQASEQELAAAYNELAEAMTGLVKTSNKSELENAVNRAKEILADKALYVEDTLENLSDTLQNAEEILADKEAAKESVEEILKKLINEILEVRLMGDVDMNGKVDTADAAVVLRNSAELNTMTAEQENIADVNRDGSCSLDDAARILQYVSEKIESF